jgi:hypothetical protein
MYFYTICSHGRIKRYISSKMIIYVAANGLLREWLPRESEITCVSQRKINHWVKLINQRPMKCLDCQTPAEVFALEKVSI